MKNSGEQINWFWADIAIGTPNPQQQICQTGMQNKMTTDVTIVNLLKQNKRRACSNKSILLLTLQCTSFYTHQFLAS